MTLQLPQSGNVLPSQLQAGRKRAGRLGVSVLFFVHRSHSTQSAQMGQFLCGQ